MVVMETGHADVPSGRMALGCHSVSGLSGMRSYRQPCPQHHTAQGQATQNTHRCEDPQVQSGSTLRVSSSPGTLDVTDRISSVRAPRTMLSFALGNGLLCLPPSLPSSAKYLNPELTQERDESTVNNERRIDGR